jgi:hypothetical protein
MRVLPTRGRRFHALLVSGTRERQGLLLNRGRQQLLSPRPHCAKIAAPRVNVLSSSRCNTAAITRVRELAKPLATCRVAAAELHQQQNRGDRGGSSELVARAGCLARKGAAELAFAPDERDC